MKSETCNSCNAEIYPTASFCYKCGHRLKCEKCGILLVKDANNCISCGFKVAIDDDSKSSSKNTVTYRKTRDETFFDASLSDDVAKDGIGNLIASITNNRLPEGKVLNKDVNDFTKDDNKNEVNTLDIDSEEIVDENIDKSEINQETPNEFPHISDVERNVNCSESEWLLIYAFYESAFAENSFTKRGVYDRYLLKRKSKAHAKNLAANWNNLFKVYFATINETEVKFKTGNLTYLINLIQGKEKGSARTVTKKRISKSDKKNEIADTTIEVKQATTKPRVSKAVSYSIVTDLDLHPQGKQSLKDFYLSYSAKGTSEIVLIFVYYIEKILARPNIDTNTIYTCYKHINIPVPIIKSAIDNLHIRKGWINTANRSDLKVTVAGENYIEHSMTKQPTNSNQ